MRALRAHYRKQDDECGSGGSLKQQIGADLKSKVSQRLRSERWRGAFDEEGKLIGFHKVLKYIVAGGVDHSIRCEVWEFLLGCYELGSTADLREQIRQARRKRYKELVEQCRLMHVSIGTGTLAYTIGSKVTDARISSKENNSNNNNSRREDDTDATSSPCRSIPPDYSFQQEDEGRDYSTASAAAAAAAQSPMAFSLVSMASPCPETEGSYYSDMSDAEIEAERPRFPLRSLIQGELASSRYSPGRVGPNSPNVVHAKFFQHKCSPWNDSSNTTTASSNLGRLKAKIDDLHARGVSPREQPRTAAGMPSPNHSLLQVSEERMADWLWTLHKIVVDVVRTDRHLKFYEDTRNMARMSDILAVYAWIDPATGYCQGMSDLLSPFVVLFDDDADAFWCFESLLRRLRHNFQMDGPVGVMQQLEALPRILELADARVYRHLVLIGAESFLFAFRMLLLHFRRELPFCEGLCMWEMMWAADYDKHSFPLDYESPEPLHLKPPSMSLKQRIQEEDCLNRLSPYYNSSPQTVFEDAPTMTYKSRSPLCGLAGARPRSLWPKLLGQQRVRTLGVSVGRHGDREISVFIVAAILVINRARFLKEAQCMDDVIKMFNEIKLKIKVRPCIRTALKLRLSYQHQLSKRSSTLRV